MERDELLSAVDIDVILESLHYTKFHKSNADIRFKPLELRNRELEHIGRIEDKLTTLRKSNPG